MPLSLTTSSRDLLLLSGIVVPDGLSESATTYTSFGFFPSLLTVLSIAFSTYSGIIPSLSPGTATTSPLNLVTTLTKPKYTGAGTITRSPGFNKTSKRRCIACWDPVVIVTSFQPSSGSKSMLSLSLNIFAMTFLTSGKPSVGP